MKIVYSAAVELALRKASHLAVQAGLSGVGPMELLHGLLDEVEGQAATQAAAAGVNLAKWRARSPGFTDLLEESATLPLDDRVALIISHAMDIARHHGAEGTLPSHHLLLAVLEKEPAARALLESLGLDFEALRNQITPPDEPIPLDEPFDIAPVTDQMDAARIVDASANRAREAMRVLEDHARFARGDAVLCGEFKNLRHQLADALQMLPADLLLQARDTVHDVGTFLSTPQEQERSSARAVIQANAKRLQEALRSLEEFGKVLDPEFGRKVEQLRYQSYTLERSLGTEGELADRLAAAKLYVLVSEDLCRASLAGTVREALAGGAQIIQLREKNLDDRHLLETARDLRRLTRDAGALFIINDRPDIARLAEADGVHLGQDDLPIREARRILGWDRLIGVSSHNLEQVRQAVAEGASYLGAGPTFPSATKTFDAYPGLEFVKQASAAARVPVFILGGITATNLPAVLAAGGKRVAVSSAICGAEDPRGEAARLRRLLDANL